MENIIILKINFNLNTDNNKNFVIYGKQKINLRNYVNSKTIKNRVNGFSIWDYTIVVLVLKAIFKKEIKIKALSNLSGSSFNFPEPLKKLKETKSNIFVSTSFTDNKFSNIKIKYKKIIFEIKSLNNLTGYVNFSGTK